jgi:anthranilate phosphoribosyltransferase
MSDALKPYLKHVFEGGRLAKADAEAALGVILDGKATPEQIAAFLGALQARQETVEEMVAFVSVLRKRALAVPLDGQGLLDTCGTGGDGSGTFNISTVSAFVLAGAGVPIAKHGNRSSSSKCGSADVLEALGVPIQLSPEKAAEGIRQRNFAFLFAPHFHPDLARVGPVRRSLGVRTVFNLIGPLVNPARVSHQIMGVYHRDLLEKVGSVLRDSGTQEAMVVASHDGLDEFSLSAPTDYVHLKDGKLDRKTATPEDFGLSRAPVSALKGGEAGENAEIALELLGGAKGPKRDVVVMNAGAALVVTGRAKDFKEGAKLAAQAIDSGAALRALAGVRS